MKEMLQETKNLNKTRFFWWSFFSFH